MKKDLLLYGLIAGFISSIWLLLFTLLGLEFDNSTGMLIGYSAMIVGFSMIFIGIKSTRDKMNNGVISFKKGFITGLQITLVASTVYVIVWLFCFYFIVPDFMDKMAARGLEELMRSQASQAAIDSYKQEMASFGEMYKNPFFNAAITYTEILPVGLIISVISALILKRNTGAGITTVA